MSNPMGWDEIFDGLPHPYIVADADEKIIACNREFLKHFGYDAEDLIGADVYSLRHVSSDILILDIAQLPLQYKNLQVWSLKTGDPVYVDVTAAEQSTSTGDVLVLSVTDVTETLSAQDYEAPESNDWKRRERFVRHEIANVIGPIQGFARFLLKNIGSDLNDSDRLKLCSIADAAEYAMSFIDASKRLSDIESGDTPLKLRKGTIGSMVQSVVFQLESRALHSGVQMDYEDSSDGTQIEMDFDILPQAIKIILENALSEEAAFSDGKNGSVAVHVTHEDDTVSVSINNSTASEKNRSVERYFDRFAARKNRMSHDGLNLAYALLAVKAHSGSVSVITPESNGTLISMAFTAVKDRGDR